MSLATKRCSVCKKVFSATTKYFHKDSHIQRDGLNSACKSCKNARNRKRRLKYKDKLNARERELWKLKNKGKRYQKHTATKNAKRRTRLSNSSGNYDESDIDRQYKIQGAICWWCNKPLPKKYHIDHRIPLSRGGHNNPSNIVLSCPRCNLTKGSKLPEEWIGRLL